MSPIPFDSLPPTIRTPGVYIEFSNRRAVQGLPLQEHRILVFGQRLSAGAVAAGVVREMFSADQARTDFGNGSLLHHLVERVKGANGNNRVFAVALDDNAGGAFAAGSMTFAGPASAAGTLYLYVGGRRVTVGVASGASAASIATSVAAALQATTSPNLAVTAAVDGVDTTKVNTTHRHKGECGNEIDLRANFNAGEAYPAGVSITFVQPTGGTGNPTLATAIAVLGDETYTEIVCPYTDATSLTALEAELTDRWGALRPYDGHAYIGKDDTAGNLTTFGNGRNSPFVTALSLKNFPTPSYEVAASLAGVVSARAQLDPARPMTYRPLPGVLAPAVGDRFTQTERNALLADGMSTVIVDSAGQVVIERLITMYQTNPAGAADESYLDLNTILNLSYLRYSWRAEWQKYSEFKLAQDGTRFGPGQLVMTPQLARGVNIALFDKWEFLGLVEDAAQFDADMIVEINASNPVRLDMLSPPNLVNPLLIVGGQIEFRR